jgi:uncharacterized protein YlbG (UPF0298 family)
MGHPRKFGFVVYEKQKVFLIVYVDTCRLRFISSQQ